MSISILGSVRNTAPSVGLSAIRIAPQKAGEPAPCGPQEGHLLTAPCGGSAECEWQLGLQQVKPAGARLSCSPS